MRGNSLKGDRLFEHQADKSFDIFESPVSGKVKRIIRDCFTIVEAGEPVMHIDDGSDAAPVYEKEKKDEDDFDTWLYKESIKSCEYRLKQKPVIPFAEEERRKMTASLRYDVLKKDDFRCVLCGRSADDDVKLHVDHILLVSKGGKTEVTNLRTLCEYCNFGKSNKYDPYGRN